MFIETAVHKAQISLRNGETIEDFVNKLSSEGKKYISQKLNLSGDNICWLVETFAKQVVFNVYKNDDSFYISVLYERDAKGNFSFSDIEEVERIVSFKPTEQESLDVSKRFGGWVKLHSVTKKSFWSDVI